MNSPQVGGEGLMIKGCVGVGVGGREVKGGVVDRMKGGECKDHDN